MLKRMIGLSLLCVAGHAHSATLNLIVNTTADENGTNSSACSLREAVTLISSGKLGVVEETTTTPKVITNGYGGCGVMKTAQITTTDDKGVTTTKLGVASDSDTYTTVIELENGKVYELDPILGRLQIKKSMSIRAITLDDINDVQGLKFPIIRATGRHGLFKVDDEKTDATSVIGFSLNQLNLEGCNTAGTQTAVCESRGGIIINNESISLSKVRLKGGFAVSGGAIYNASSDARLVTNDVEFSGNKAENGAAIYVEKSGLLINRSLFQKNTATATANFGAVIWMATQGKELESDVIVRTNSIANSTFAANTAYASNLVRDMRIVSSTIVGNVGGVYLNASGLANLSNSIIAGNGAHDCEFAAGNQAYINHLLYNSGCGQSANDHITGSTQLVNSGSTTLIADANNDQVCDKPPAMGLLCPLRAGKDDFNALFKPRLLMSYTRREESPIVNQGYNAISTPQVLSCESVDQRNKDREQCDIGAIELVANAAVQTNGQDILYGQKATLDLTDIMGDGELLPAESCANFYPSIAVPNGGWQNGCLLYSRAPLKGVQMFLDDHTVEYTPTSDFHGADVYQYNVVTTTSRFSDAESTQTVRIQTTIVQEPPNTFENKKANLSGGSTGVLGLFGLMGLAWMRRRTQGARPQ